METGPFWEDIPLVPGYSLQITSWDYRISEWLVDGNLLTEEEIKIAKQIMGGELDDQLPLYINHPILKFFVQKALSDNPEFDKAYYLYD